jgi:hypothetical protein
VSVDEDTLAQTVRQKAAVFCDYCEGFHVMRIGEMFCVPDDDEEAA